MMGKGNLTEKIQVLVDKEDLQAINFLIFKSAFMNDEKPVSVSSYIREIIKNHIIGESNEQMSYANVHVKKAFELLQKEKSNGGQE